MCATCGCSEDSRPRLTDLASGTTQTIDDAGTHSSHPVVHHADHEHRQPDGHDGHHHDHDHEHHYDHDHHHHHHHDHGSGHDHHHDHGPSAHRHTTTIRLEADVLAKNNRLAERNRGWLAGRNILALNLVSAPGAGKTTLLERTLRDL